MFSTPNFRNSDTCKNNFPYEMVKIKLSGLKKGNFFFFPNNDLLYLSNKICHLSNNDLLYFRHCSKPKDYKTLDMKCQFFEFKGLILS